MLALLGPLFALRWPCFWPLVVLLVGRGVSGASRQFLPLGAPWTVPAVPASRGASGGSGGFCCGVSVPLLAWWLSFPCRRGDSSPFPACWLSFSCWRGGSFSCWRGGSVHVAARGASGGFGASVARGASGDSGVLCRSGHPKWFLRFLRFLPLVWLFRLATASEASCDDRSK